MMTKNEEAYALGFSEGLSYGIELMMEELKKFLMIPKSPHQPACSCVDLWITTIKTPPTSRRKPLKP